MDTDRANKSTGKEKERLSPWTSGPGADDASIGIWAITPNGLELGRRLACLFPGASLFASKNAGKDKDENRQHRIKTIRFSSLAEELAENFFNFRNHVFIFSTGIAVRMIAPLIRSKTCDPAVVVLDEKGLYAISLISGHLGGANHLARRLGEKIMAQPVITTATDINELPSIDLLAKDRGLFIENPGVIKRINMAFLKGNKISIHDPEHLIKPNIPSRFLSEGKLSDKKPSIACTWKTPTVPRETLILRPMVLSVGIGCNRNTDFKEILDLMTRVFQEKNLSINSCFTLASTTVKKDETGILKLAEKLDLPINFYTKSQLNSVETIENPSKMVEKHLGVKSVCEAAAILAAQRGRLIVPKLKSRNATLAVALLP